MATKPTLKLIRYTPIVVPNSWACCGTVRSTNNAMARNVHALTTIKKIKFFILILFLIVIKIVVMTHT